MVSERLAKDLKRKGFKFVGLLHYSYLQATGN